MDKSKTMNVILKGFAIGIIASILAHIFISDKGYAFAASVILVFIYYIYEYERRTETLQKEVDTLNDTIKANQERFESDYTQLLNRQQLKPTKKDSWGQKEYEHYKSKL